MLCVSKDENMAYLSCKHANKGLCTRALGSSHLQCVTKDLESLMEMSTGCKFPFLYRFLGFRSKPFFFADFS